MRPPRESLQIMGVMALAAALLATAVQLQAVREEWYPPAPITDESLILSSPKAFKALTASMNALAADVYWIRAIQYYGGVHRKLGQTIMAPPPPASIAWTSDYEQLYPLLDLTTEADPRFSMAYRFGAVFLGEPFPTGANRPDLAIKLLEKGLREQPDKWQYMQDIGFVYYWYEQDYRSAATWFNQASSIPGSPWWLKSMAATTMAAGGDRKTSRLMWLAIEQSADNDWLRNEAQRRLTQLKALDQIEALQERVTALATNSGQRVTGWEALIQARILRSVPIDPMGTPYDLDTEGRVRLRSSSPLWPLPEEGVRLPGAGAR